MLFALRASCFLIGFTMSATLSPAEVVKLQQFRLGEKGNEAAKFSARIDGGVKFSTAVSPSGDVLSLIAKDSGKWELYRVRNAFGSPSQDRLVLPGFFSKKDKQGLDSLRAYLYISSDGRFAICAAGASWYDGPRTRPTSIAADDVISLVDLSAFNIVTSTHTRDLPIFPTRSIKLDHEDHVLLDSSMWTGQEWRYAFVRLDIPSLTPGPACHYQSNPTTVTACEAALGPSVVFQEYRRREMPTGTELFPDWRLQMPSLCATKHVSSLFIEADEVCHWYKLTDDKKFGLAERSTVSLNIVLDWYSSGRSVYIAFDATNGSQIGEIPVQRGSVPEFHFGYSGGRDYLVAIENGTLVNIYELRE